MAEERAGSGTARGQSGKPAADAPLSREERLERAREARRQIASRTITTITTALALVAALFWQTAITDTIKNFIPTSGAWQYEVVVALFVTLLAAVMIYVLSKPIDGEGKGGK